MKKKLPEITNMGGFGPNTHQRHLLHNISSWVGAVSKIKGRKEDMVL